MCTQMGAFMLDREGKPYTGRVWPGNTHFPDFTSKAGKAFWSKLLHNWHASGAAFHGLWTDMNEPSNFVSGAPLPACTSCSASVCSVLQACRHESDADSFKFAPCCTMQTICSKALQ